MFNTLSNALAVCPHCRKQSAVGASYRRSRIIYYSTAVFISLMIALFFTLLAFLTHPNAIVLLVYVSLLSIFFGLSIYCSFKALKFYAARISTIVAPV